MKRVILVLTILAFAFSYANAQEKEVKKEEAKEPEIKKVEVKEPEAGKEEIKKAEVKGDEVLADVNGTKITMADFEEEIANLPQNYRSAISANKRKFLDEIILREILYQEAAKEGLDKDKEVVSALEGFKRKIMAQKLIGEILGGVSVSEDELKKYYEEHKDEYRTDEQLKAAHILVKVEESAGEEEDKAALEKAEGLLKQVKEGGDFSELARDNSDCPSGKKGGELGYFSHGQLVPEFEEAAFSLKAGEVSGIVKTRFGYHIIKLIDRKEAKQKEFDEVKEELEKMLLAEKQKESFISYTDAIREKAKVTINEELLVESGSE